MLDYGARLYDPLTARWNGVDALAEKYSSFSTYGYVGGNPISRVDLDGRDTWYYNETGEFLRYVDDGLPNGICVISNDNPLNANLAMSMLEGENCSAMSSFVREQFGTTYLVDKLLAFDAKYRNNTDGQFYREDEYPDMPIVSANGKKRVFAEYGIRLGLNKMREVDVLGEPYTSNIFNALESQPRMPGQVSAAHLHPAGGKLWSFLLKRIDLKGHPQTRREIISGEEPSRSDWRSENGKDAVNYTKNVYYNMAIDDKFIRMYRNGYSYNDKYGRTHNVPSSEITIPKNIFAK